MRIRSLLPLLVVLLVSTSAAFAAETAEVPGMKAAAQGEALLDQGKVEEAARVYAEAVRMSPRHKGIVDRAMVLRRVVSLRRSAARGPKAKRWDATAAALHAFYLYEDLPSLAEDVAQRAYDHQPTDRTSVMVAEALLAGGKDAEAARHLSGRKAPSAQERILHGIAMARLGHADAARSLTADVKLDAKAHPALRQDLARLKARLGDREAAYALLKTSFEETPVMALEAARKRVRTSPDFTALAGEKAFQDVLETPSKVKQTCSGGSSCGSCPNRGSCGK